MNIFSKYFIALLLFSILFTASAKEKDQTWILTQTNAFYPNGEYSFLISSLGLRTNMDPLITIVNLNRKRIFLLHNDLKKYNEISFQEWLKSLNKLPENNVKIINKGKTHIAGLTANLYHIKAQETSFAIESENEIANLPESITKIWIAEDIPISNELKPFLDFHIPIASEIPLKIKGVILKIVFSSESMSKTILDTTSYKIIPSNKDHFTPSKDFRKTINTPSK